MSFVLPEWCVFWLLAKDALRLDEIYSYTFGSRGRMEKSEPPVESLAKLILFEGNLAVRDSH